MKKLLDSKAFLAVAATVAVLLLVAGAAAVFDLPGRWERRRAIHDVISIMDSVISRPGTTPPRNR